MIEAKANSRNLFAIRKKVNGEKIRIFGFRVYPIEYNNSCWRKDCLYFIAPTNLNGKSRIPLTILNTNSSVKPTILNGNRISQTNGRRKIAAMASGQQTTKSKHQSNIPINVLM